MTDEQYEQGLRARREVLGDKHVDRAIERTTPLTEPFQDGLSNAEIREVLLHSAVYAGVPAANAAFGIARRVLEE